MQTDATFTLGIMAVGAEDTEEHSTLEVEDRGCSRENIALEHRV
jgi:hypothetical protein